MLDLSEFRSVYLEELDEQIQIMEEELLRVEKAGSAENGIQRLFRAAHTLKGSSAAMGFFKMKSLTHEMEHLLDKVRNNELQMTDRLTVLFFQSVDLMKILQQEIVQHNQEMSDIHAMTLLLANYMHEHEHEQLQVQEAPHSSKLVPRSAAKANELLSRLEAASSSGVQFKWVKFTLAADCGMKQARMKLIEMSVCETADLFCTIPDLSAEWDEPDNHRQLDCLIGCPLTTEELAARLEGLSEVEGIEIQECGMEQLQSELSPKKEAVLQEPAEPVIGDKTKAQTIRVNVDRLEHLMNLVGELLIDQTRMQQLDKDFRQQFGSNEATQELEQLSDHLQRTIGNLQESVMKVRMLPIEQLFVRFPRMIRDLCRTLGKEVELILEGGDTELDRTLIEDLGDPLIHIIRNAVDHGIESPEVRREAGKPAKGTLRINAAHEDNQVMITIEDDGAGIHADKILRSAAAKGMISQTEAESMTEREAVNLIFHPGFSMASKVSDISGRGVGMDIVRTDIERMNGLIEIVTEKGKGTIFKIRLPLTLAIITGLLVQLSGRTFVLPMTNVTEIVRIDPAMIKKVKGVPVLFIRNQVIPIVWLHDHFGYERSDHTKKHIPIVIIGRAEKRIALAVDELLGNQEVVIKSLGSFIGKVEGISGATILGNGKLALILEAGSIIKMNINSY
ncbi:chemotaxis protein CheA [Paenibacillus spongiae]|uniref:Chemotaxis protein CheA n=1 Tax=Paenibacillus spongiae TaxID=2909671 RepID=A0ABY5SBC6_9BACL|nr:chemotaxis protein CheA [Paenibacillus spongiae]UVI31252.1 chemotaxis protein CheA [Paenibacillus spongiae]